MYPARYRQSKGWNRGIKIIAVVRDHLVAALHAADRRFQHGTTRILKMVARVQVGLFTDDSFTTDFLNVTVAVGNDPVSCKQLRRHLPGILNRYRI